MLQRPAATVWRFWYEAITAAGFHEEYSVSRRMAIFCVGVRSVCGRLCASGGCTHTHTCRYISDAIRLLVCLFPTEGLLAGVVLLDLAAVPTSSRCFTTCTTARPQSPKCGTRSLNRKAGDETINYTCRKDEPLRTVNVRALAANAFLGQSPFLCRYV